MAAKAEGKRVINSEERAKWDLIREVIWRYLELKESKRYRLAIQAGISDSALYKFLHEDLDNRQLKIEPVTGLPLLPFLLPIMSPTEIEVYLDVFDLQSFAQQMLKIPLSAVSKNWEWAGDTPEERGRLLMHIGDYTSRQSWSDSLQFYREAEVQYGPGSSAAAAAGNRIALELINLNDLATARGELLRVERIYKGIMDYASWAQYYRLQGWISYYLGGYQLAIEQLQKNMDFARRAGDNRIAQPHFIGRAYHAQGLLARSNREAERLFHLAAKFLNLAHDYHAGWAHPFNQGYDIFRLGQLYLDWGLWHDAEESRRKAGFVFENHPARHHVDIEEAGIALNDGETRQAIRLAEKTLDGWAQIGYARGMASALAIIGLAAYWEGKHRKGLRYLIMAQCLHPFGSPLRDISINAEINQLRLDLAQESSWQQFYSLIRKIQEEAEIRDILPFRYLDSIDLEHLPDIGKVFDSFLSRN